MVLSETPTLPELLPAFPRHNGPGTGTLGVSGLFAGHVSSWRPAPQMSGLSRSIRFSSYGLNCDGRMTQSASDATGPAEAASAMLAGLRHAQGRR